LHEAVCEAIERGDAEAAERAALVLIDGAEEDLRELAPVRPATPAVRREAVAAR
jgi:DNA-binding GntR family transcriptional regulator